MTTSSYLRVNDVEAVPYILRRTILDYLHLRDLFFFSSTQFAGCHAHAAQVKRGQQLNQRIHDRIKVYGNLASYLLILSWHISL